jgi:hypothetical protein
VCTGPPLVLAPDLLNIFEEGNLAGATASLEGISFSLGVKPEQEDALKIGIEAGHVAFDVVAEIFQIAHLAMEEAAITAEVIGATAGGVMLGLALPVINLLAALEVYAPDPKDVADLLGDALTERFGEFGARGPSVFSWCSQLYRSIPLWAARTAHSSRPNRLHAI